MDQATLEHFRGKLKSHRDSLMNWYQNEMGTETLEREELEEFQRVIAAHEEALQRIDTGNFGRCVKCVKSGEVESDRLELDFTTRVCLSHYSEKQIRALEADLELAAKVHRQLLPAAVPSLEHIEISAHTESARIVGGDYFDFYPSPSGLQGVAIADVMGKGLPASMLVPNLQASLRILGPQLEEPHVLATRINELFRYNLKLIRFISIFIASLDAARRMIRYCNAGHNPPLFFDASVESISWLKPTGPAIGLTHEPTFKTAELQMSSGDVLVLYTDGLIEGNNSAGEEFGEERLSAYVRSHAKLSAKAILEGLTSIFKQHVGGPLQDDLTVLVLKF